MHGVSGAGDALDEAWALGCEGCCAMGSGKPCPRGRAMLEVGGGDCWCPEGCLGPLGGWEEELSNDEEVS